MSEKVYYFAMYLIRFGLNEVNNNTLMIDLNCKTKFC